MALTINPDFLLDLFRPDDGLIACIYAGEPDPDAPVNCAPLAHARVSTTRRGSGAFFTPRDALEFSEARSGPFSITVYNGKGEALVSAALTMSAPTVYLGEQIATLSLTLTNDAWSDPQENFAPFEYSLDELEDEWEEPDYD